MNYIYDILINLSTNKSYEFYEWRDDDNIYHIRKIPVFKISEKDFFDIKQNKVSVNSEFLLIIKNKTEVYQDMYVGHINYLCAFACTVDVLVVEFDKNGKSINKSNMLLEEADDTLYEISDTLEEVIDYKIIEKETYYNTDNTRYEEEIKNYINSEIDYIIKHKDYSKMKYLYYEWFEKKCNDNKKIIHGLKKIASDEYSNKLDEFLDIIKLTNKSI